MVSFMSIVLISFFNLRLFISLNLQGSALQNLIAIVSLLFSILVNLVADNIKPSPFQELVSSILNVFEALEYLYTVPGVIELSPPIHQTIA